MHGLARFGTQDFHTQEGGHTVWIRRIQGMWRVHVDEKWVATLEGERPAIALREWRVHVRRYLADGTTSRVEKHEEEWGKPGRSDAKWRHPDLRCQ